MRAFLLSILLSAPTVFVSSQSLYGDWNGTINIGPTSLPLVMHISSHNGEDKCLLDSPNQGAKDIVSLVDYLSADSISLRVPAIGASYSGRLHGGEIKGVFSQSGMKFALNLKPGNFKRERKQTPKTPLLYPTEEVVFENPIDKAKFSGTLSYPLTYSMNKNVPVVLMVTGSGLQNRDEEVMEHKPFAVIADFLAKMGIASLRYDDRGFGKSTGSLENATSYTFMTDALAGINYLKSTGKFSKIGILGHSEGGMISFMAAKENPHDIDFIISLAGMAVRGDEILLKQNEQLFSSNPQTAVFCDDYCKVLRKVFQHLINKKPVDNAEAIVNNYVSEVGAKLPIPALQNLQKVLTTSTPWLEYLLGYDPACDISKISCPVMAVNGDKDVQVDAVMNLEAIKKTLPANKKHLIRSYSGLNHLFQHCNTGSVSEYGSIEETISPEVLSDIADWINGLK